MIYEVRTDGQVLGDGAFDASQLKASGILVLRSPTVPNPSSSSFSSPSASVKRHDNDGLQSSALQRLCRRQRFWHLPREYARLLKRVTWNPALAGCSLATAESEAQMSALACLDTWSSFARMMWLCGCGCSCSLTSNGVPNSASAIPHA